MGLEREEETSNSGFQVALYAVFRTQVKHLTEQVDKSKRQHADALPNTPNGSRLSS